MREANLVEIYTDGACRGNPGPGGWAALLRFNDAEKIISGAEQETTNNRMELTAVIEAIKYVKTDRHIDIYSDSHIIRIIVGSFA